MHNDTGTYRRWRRRVITVISLGVAMVAAIATPALAHPVFSNDPPGYPNPQGSPASPYSVGSRPTLNMFLPFEQEGVVFNGAENTTVEVKVTIPAGWTGPACGAASTSPSTGYRQVGTVVPGWSCAIDTVSAHQVLHWSGPQVSASQGFVDSAQFFTFQVTVPSPTTRTSYGATGGPEGFYVEQVYANRATSLWRTPNDTTRPGEVANGLVRTVAGTTAPPPNQTAAPEPTETHAGPNKPKPAPSGANPQGPNLPGAANPAGTKPTGPPAQGGGRTSPAPAGQPLPPGPLTAGELPAAPAQGSAEPTSAQPTPAADSPPSSATEPLAQRRDDATAHGLGWQVLVGIVIGAALVVGTVIAVVRRRRSL